MAQPSTPADRLTNARIASGFKTRMDVINATGWKYPTVAAHENGTRPLTRDFAEKYAKKYGVTAGWLLYGEASKIDELPEPVQHLIQHALQSPPEVVQAALAMFRSFASKTAKLTTIYSTPKTNG